MAGDITARLCEWRGCDKVVRNGIYCHPHRKLALAKGLPTGRTRKRARFEPPPVTAEIPEWAKRGK